MRTAKEQARRALSYALVWSGAAAAGRALFPKGGALILYGHRVARDDEGYLEGLRPGYLDDQLRYLTRHYEPLTLSQLLACYEQRRPVPAQSFVLTFDDGFRDNLTAAFPLLQRYGLVATVFVTTGCATSGELPWPQRLGVLFQRTSKTELSGRAAAVPGREETWPLDTARARRRAYLAVKEALKPLTRGEREARLASLVEALEVEPPADRMLSWEDLRELQAGGWEVGAHTFSHPWLARVPSAEAEEELLRCREDLADRLGVRNPPFCFPAGSWTPALLERVQALGFRSAFRPSPPQRVNTLANSDPFSLGRTGLPDAPAAVLAAELDGPLPWLRQLWRGGGAGAAAALLRA